MDKYQATFTLLPHIMALLKRKINYSSTVELLYTELMDSVPEEELKGFKDFKSAMQFALHIGAALGVIALEDDLRVEDPEGEKITDQVRKIDAIRANRERVGDGTNERPLPFKKTNCTCKCSASRQLA